MLVGCQTLSVWIRPKVPSRQTRLLVVLARLPRASWHSCLFPGRLWVHWQVSSLQVARPWPVSNRCNLSQVSHGDQRCLLRLSTACWQTCLSHSLLGRQSRYAQRSKLLPSELRTRGKAANDPQAHATALKNAT